MMDDDEIVASTSDIPDIRESRECFNLVSDTKDDSSDNGSAMDPYDGLTVFLNKTWNVWGVSSMFNFKCTSDLKLNAYAKQLREEIASIVARENISYVAKFEVLDISKPKESDHPVVMIQVHGKIEGKQEESCIYEGYLFSWRSETNFQPLVNSSRLPILLSRGTKNTIQAVHLTLGRMFDCTIVELAVNEEDLKWILPIAIKATKDNYKENHVSTLSYAVPDLPNNDISVNFESIKLFHLWQSICVEPNKIVSKEVEIFHEIIHDQITEISGLKLKMCLFNKIDLPMIAISGNKIKVKSATAMNAILTYLNEKAVNALHINTNRFNNWK